MPFATEIHPVPGKLVDSTADLLVLPLIPGDSGPEAVEGVAESGLTQVLPASLTDLFAHYSLTGKPGELAHFPVPRDQGLVRLALLGVGSGSPDDLRKAGAALARAARGNERVALAWPGSGAEAATAFAEGVLLASYTFSLKTSEVPDDRRPAASVEVASGDGDDGSLAGALERGTALAAATALARDLINTPSLTKDPEWMAARARDVAADKGLQVRVWDEKDLENDGFGAILGVGQGSSRPPRLVQLSYTPENPAAHVVLVGKGITFDTGGLSLKPNDNMSLMKTDMSGSAIVLAVLSALAAVGAAVRVTGLLALAENAFSGDSTRIGDVLTTYTGTTVEVLNSDAEGRLVLADAMGYAVGELAPDVLVDVATLTGAAKVALGTGTGALYSNDEELAAQLEEAGRDSGEPLWRMPLTEEYVPTTKSRVADLANIGTRGRDFGPAGATDAALFLREFAGDVPWAHLDIAGPGRSMKESGLLSKGGTAFTTRTLLRWLADR
ncbi:MULTISPECIES: leucyl aminopeptidase [Nocardiopsidaceae]|uniref:Probable cytosol aminopeptidase n=2 Tax=Nocardiopsidaceae TaxID=83676 RepID=A0ABY6YPV3_9ACTN|nr:leucyl aminopeptidase [Streptomonospora nanhaiensis]MEE2042922.1 leucyl aminopeptidase [Nocardiopsis tropica]WAE74414.1 leucyl aminopeptidase [Streptomonospora nanhaiensis]